MKIFFIILAFIFGFYICLNYSHNNVFEYFQNSNNNNIENCPNILIQKGNVFWLLNKNKKPIPGINPIIFENLSEYVKYVEWQEQNNIECPVLYFQEIETTQGKKELRHFPDYFNKKAGLPSFNKLLYSSKTNDYTPLVRKTSDFYSLDKIYNENAEKTENAMDRNWIGANKSRKNVEKAKFSLIYKNQINMKNNTNSNKHYLIEKQQNENHFSQDEHVISQNEPLISEEELLSNRIKQRNIFDFNNYLS